MQQHQTNTDFFSEPGKLNKLSEKLQQNKHRVQEFFFDKYKKKNQEYMKENKKVK